MSLFKVRDFWTFELDALQLQTDDAVPVGQGTSVSIDAVEEDHKEGNFIATIGRFSSIGNQDVFVCGDLRGSLYIVQVPVADQRMWMREKNPTQKTRSPTNAAQESPSGSSSSSNSLNIEDRQLLAATKLELPIADIKCGYFTSAVKQSVAVLSFDKLLILQVKRHQATDLLSDTVAPATVTFSQRKIIDQNLLSHEFDECLQFDLLAHQFACGLVVLDSHAGRTLSDSNQKNVKKETDALTTANKHDEAKKFANRSNLIVQQLHLPQRDKLIVQYVDQFLFTLIESKKILGHFSVVSGKTADRQGDRDAPDSRLQQMVHSVGSAPMTYLHNHRVSSSLILSFSDHWIHCIPLDKLISESKQDIMKRVTMNLLQHDSSNEKNSSSAFLSSDLISKTARLISVDIESIADWSYELFSMPLQMEGVQRKARSLISASHKDELTVSQLLVMSRYTLDLFTSCGRHLWSQRFETPLINSCAHILDPINSKDDDEVDVPSSTLTLDGGKQKVQILDRLVSLLCADDTIGCKSNLVILKENQIHWSALLNAKPIKIWRANLANMPGLLAMLDIKQNQLIVSYLGTNYQSSSDDDKQTDNSCDENVGDISKLELFHQPLFKDDNCTKTSGDNLQIDRRKRLVFEVSLDASGKWPDVSVDLCARLQLDSGLTSVIHDIVATFEFDDLLRFELSPSEEQSLSIISKPARGVVRIQLGNCWPDRREPIYLRGIFSLINSSRASCGAAAIDELEGRNENARSSVNSKLTPKTLKVHVFLSYKETHSSLFVQEEVFLLPISMMLQLVHVDYTNGVGQNLDDVLNNLDQYKRKSDMSKQPHSYYCDLFLQLECDLIGWLDAFVERDLVCRSTSSEARRRRQLASIDGQVETLENINLLAQSLDCRLRYKNPAGMARQVSEDIVMPVMASFAFRFDNTYKDIERYLIATNRDESDGDVDCDTVWIHMCSLDQSGSSVPQELVMRHMKDWMRYLAKGRDAGTFLSEPELDDNSGQHNFLISIESDNPLASLFMLDHLLERARDQKGSKVNSTKNLIWMNNYETYESFYPIIRSGTHLAISVHLHDSLRSMLDSYQTGHVENFKNLRNKLDQEYCKFHVVTMAILSLSKRLPSLPDHLSEHLRCLSALVKTKQQHIMGILNELIYLKDTDYQLSKLPSLPVIKIRPVEDSEPERSWNLGDRLID